MEIITNYINKGCLLRGSVFLVLYGLNHRLPLSQISDLWLLRFGGQMGTLTTTTVAIFWLISKTHFVPDMQQLIDQLPQGSLFLQC